MSSPFQESDKLAEGVCSLLFLAPVNYGSFSKPLESSPLQKGRAPQSKHISSRLSGQRGQDA